MEGTAMDLHPRECGATLASKVMHPTVSMVPVPGRVRKMPGPLRSWAVEVIRMSLPVPVPVPATPRPCFTYYCTACVFASLELLRRFLPWPRFRHSALMPSCSPAHVAGRGCTSSDVALGRFWQLPPSLLLSRSTFSTCLWASRLCSSRPHGSSGGQGRGRLATPTRQHPTTSICALWCRARRSGRDTTQNDGPREEITRREQRRNSPGLGII